MIYVFYPDTGLYCGTRDKATASDPDETPLPPCTVADGQVARWDGATWAAVPIPLDTEALIAAAWTAADAFAEAGMDTNSRTSLLWLAMDSACPQWRRDRILAVQAWWAAIWAHYADVKARIQSGEDIHFDPAIPGQCPYTIWQIAGSEP
jgi:hypothetical protein